VIPTHWTQDDLDINGASLHYLRTGDSSKPPLVLQHGFSDNGTCWLQTALDLEDSYDIIMPDARGHGLSARVQPGQAVDMAADLVGIIQALGLDRPVIGGHSMGANIAFQVGVQYPEIPRAILLEDPPWFPIGASIPASQPQEHPMSSWVETIQKSTLDELIAQTRDEHPTWPEWVIHTWTPAKKQLDPNILTILRVSGSDWAENASKLACPTLVVSADPDRGGLVTPEIAARAQQLNPLIKVTHIPGTGHHVRFEDYQSYMQTVRSFLAGIEG
jgi:pimeloyl-ACP methyl ester carboxylesterase